MEWKTYFGYKISNTGLVTKKNSEELQHLKVHKRGYLLAHIQIGDVKTKKMGVSSQISCFSIHSKSRPKASG